MPSARFTAAALAQESAECPVFLVTIEHADFPEPLRWCTGGADITSNGDLFSAVAMKVMPPGDSPEANARRGRITVDNTTPAAVGMLRLAANGQSVKIEIILAGYPDDIEVSWEDLVVVNQRPNAPAIELELVEREDTGEIFPKQSFNSRRFPALYDTA